MQAVRPTLGGPTYRIGANPRWTYLPDWCQLSVDLLTGLVPSNGELTLNEGGHDSIQVSKVYPRVRFRDLG